MTFTDEERQTLYTTLTPEIAQVVTTAKRWLTELEAGRTECAIAQLPLLVEDLHALVMWEDRVLHERAQLESSANTTRALVTAVHKRVKLPKPRLRVVPKP